MAQGDIRPPSDNITSKVMCYIGSIQVCNLIWLFKELKNIAG
jgi:hypothetical protein